MTDRGKDSRLQNDMLKIQWAHIIIWRVFTLYENFISKKPAEAEKA